MAAARSDQSRDKLIAAVYDAAVDDDAFSRLAGSIGRAFDSDSVVVWNVDHGRVASSPSITFSESYVAPYHEYYHRLDPWFAFSSRWPALTTRLSDDILPECAFRETEFYVDFSRQVGACHAALSSFFIARDHLGCINVMRPQDARAFDEPDRRALDRLLPHLQRALQIRYRLGGENVSGIGCSALDALAFGALVCDGEGHVLFANATAESLANSRTVLRLGDCLHGVSLRGREQTRRLAGLISDAASGGSGGGLRASAEDGPALFILVTPLPRRFGDNGDTHGLVLVALRAATDGPGAAASVLGTMFGLTPAETELTFALFSGRSLAEIMTDKSIAESTVRTQLTRVLHKTDCRNQRELANLLGRLPQLR